MQSKQVYFTDKQESMELLIATRRNPRGRKGRYTAEKKIGGRERGNGESGNGERKRRRVGGWVGLDWQVQCRLVHSNDPIDAY